MRNDLDLAKKPGFSLTKLEQLLDDIRYQPIWRPEADRAADYYDGLQLEPRVIAEMKARGQPILIHNLIAPAINGVLGLEAKTRTDWKLVADDDSGLEVVEALNQELNEAARIAMADRACADAYAAQLKTGLGWVEIGRNTDPFEYPYRANYIHRNEIFWDWHAKRPDLKDAKWMLRRKWLDVDELVMAFPQYEDLINQVSNGWTSIGGSGGLWNEDEPLMGSQPLMGAYSDQASSSIPEDDWWDSQRKRALTYEVYYRVWDKKPVIKTETGEVFVYNQDNPLHVAVLAAGRAEVSIAPFPRMRLAYFIGPHRVADLESPHPHNLFPYVPFWGYREDRSGIPYGMVRGMMPAQDEINHRRSKLTWLLNAKLVVKDDDALLDMSDNEMLDELYRADGVITLNPARKNKDANAFRIIESTGVAAQQFQVMQEAQKMIQDVAGIYNAFLGQESGAKSGIAIDSLVEQGTTTLAEINDNYSVARQLVGELLLAHIVDDIGDKRKEVKLNVNKPQATKVIVLNDRKTIDGGRTQITNSVTRTKTRVVLSDIQNTPGYRQQMARSLMELAGQLPEQYTAALIDLIVELGDFPNREEVLKRIRQVSGMGVNPQDLSEEERAQMERKAQLQQQMEEMQFEAMKLELEELKAKVRGLNAKAAESESKVEAAPADREKTMAEIQEIRAKVKDIVTKVAGARQQMKAVIDGEIALESKRMPKGLPAQLIQ
jgi:hypothetical protein